MAASGAVWDEGVVSMQDFRETYGADAYRASLSKRPPSQKGSKPLAEPNWFVLWLPTNPKTKLFDAYRKRTLAASSGLASLSVELHDWAKDTNSERAEFTKRIGDWQLRARAIPYRHLQCISCHPSAKVGDTAAVAVVAVHSPGPD